jgi:hypothetical protein
VAKKKKKERELRDARRRSDAHVSADNQFELGVGQRIGVYATPASAEAHQALIDRIRRTAPLLPDVTDDDYDWLS